MTWYWIALIALAGCDEETTPPPFDPDTVVSDVAGDDGDDVADEEDVAEDSDGTDAVDGVDASCECDDGNPCTLDRCVGGVCEHEVLLDEACDDGSACTDNDACDADAICVGVPRVCHGGPDALAYCGPTGGCHQTERSDLVAGAEVPRSQSWWIEGGRIYRGQTAFVPRGASWFGLETEDNALHGLWAEIGIGETLTRARGMGLNALRIPVAPTTLDNARPVAEWAAARGWQSGRQILRALLNEAEDRGMAILLDLHTCDPAVGIEAGFPTDCPGYEVADWHATLDDLANLALPYPNVMGIEIFNEPWKMTWSAWAAQAAEAGEVVLAANPHVLIFVEGVAGASNYGRAEPTYGGNLLSAAVIPVELPASRRVYGPHVYGPSVFSPLWRETEEPVFEDPAFPAVLDAVWEEHFGHLISAGEAVVITEMGDLYDDALAPGGVAWLDHLVRWMRERPLHGFFYWSLNPNSADTGGLLGDDWVTVERARLQALAPLLWP